MAVFCVRISLALFLSGFDYNETMLSIALIVEVEHIVEPSTSCMMSPHHELISR